MKTKLLAVMLAGGVALCGVGFNSAFAQTDERGATSGKTGTKPKGKYGETGVELAQEISKDEAMKKYPARGGSYPSAETMKGPDSGMSTTVIESPYPPHHKFDTTGINRGALILDPYAKHVFVKP